jgi:hypothetical protein
MIKGNINFDKLKTRNNYLRGWGQNRKIFVSLIENNLGVRE